MEEVAIEALKADLVLESLKIMVVGMVTVFAFLWFMILFLKVQGKFLTRFFPQKEAVATTVPQSTPTGGSDTSLIAAISAAISMHKKAKNKGE